MTPEERIRISLLIEKMNENKNAADNLGLTDESKFKREVPHGETLKKQLGFGKENFRAV